MPAFLRMFGGALSVTYIPLYVADLGASKAVIGVVVGCHAAGLLAADLPAGLLVSRLGTRRSMSLGLLGMAAAFGLTSMVSSVALFASLLFFAGFCSALVHVSQLTIMRHAMPDRTRGRALALVGGTARLAGVAAPVLGGILVEREGYGAVFCVYASLLACACVLFLCLGPQRQARPHLRTEGAFSAVRRLARENRRVLLPAGSTLFVLTVLRASRRVLLPLWGYDMGLSPTAIGAVVSAGAAADVLLFPLGGILSDKKGRRWSLTACMGFFSIGLVTLMAVGGEVLGLTLVAVWIGIGNGLGAGINMTVGTDLAPKGRDTSPFLGLWRVLTDTGGTAGPLVVGVLSESLSLGPASALIGLAGLAGIAAMWRFMPETKGFR